MPSPSQLTNGELIISLISSVLFAFISAYYGEKKGRSSLAWFILGFLFTIFTLIVLYFLPAVNDDEKKKKESQESERDSTFDDEAKDAPPKEMALRLEPVDERVWFYLNDKHEQVGPMSIVALNDLWNRGLVDKRTYVWSEGMTEWQRIENISDLLAKFE